MPTSRRRAAKVFSIAASFSPRAKAVSTADVRSLAAAVSDSLHGQDRVSKSLGRELQRIERECRFTRAARAEFQDLLGALGLDSAFPIGVPASDQPLWSRYQHPLANYRSRPALPEHADVVIIGAGLTGASAAYHLLESAAQGQRIIVLERGSPACEASGRNAGNFELLPENSVGTYRGFARERMKFLLRCYPDIPREVLRIEAERQASLVLSFAVRNRERLKQIIQQENIPCDFSPKGWLYLAHTEGEEQAICDEAAMANRQDQQVEIWSRLKIRQEFGFDSDFLGRFVPGDGTYHPGKFVYGILQVAVAGGVELYTGVAVQRVRTENKSQLIETDQGTIKARTLIVATNAFTRDLFPELGAISPAQSQISVTEFAPDRCRGRVVTSEDGPVYFNQPRSQARGGMAPLLLGGGKDRPIRNASSRRRSPQIHAELLKLRDRFFPELKRRPFSTEWVGPIALTPDQIPAMGFLQPGIVIAAGFNGYGGSYCVAAGQAAAEMAISGAVPDWLPEDVFSPQRLLNDKPLFLGEISSLWCYAASLCVQLRGINRQLADALGHSSRKFRHAASEELPRKTQSEDGIPQTVEVTAHGIRSLKAFRRFSVEECDAILGMGKVHTVKVGDLLQSESEAAGACFVVMTGKLAAEATTASDKLFSSAGPGALIGHIGLLDGGGDFGTYVAEENATVLKIKHEDCHQLLAQRSALSHKFLEALTESIVEQLQKAERQLAGLNRQHKPKLPIVRVAAAR